jgi:hypothetical protein
MVPSAEQVVKRQRLAQSRRELSQLKEEIAGWLSRRTKNDVHQQYVTQLGVLDEKFAFMLRELGIALDKVPSGGSARELYAACRDIDSRVLWVRRVYTWYRTKFDQRDDPRLQPLLAAADEVVWSCYVQPFRAMGKTPPAVPLPYVDPTYSPFAIPRVQPPPDLRTNIHASVLTKLLAHLPVPVVGLPPNCVDEPWWLAFLAHEVGHHVHYDLLPDSGLVTLVETAIGAAAGVRWKSWQHEVFADLYSVLMIGPWASWALAELVWGTDIAMLDGSDPRYPAPLARLMLMAEVATQLKVDHLPALRGIEPDTLLEGPPPAIAGWPDQRGTVKTDAAAIPKLVTALLERIKPGAKRLASLAEFKAAEFKGPKADVPLWADALRGRKDMRVSQKLRAVRVVLAGGVAAWSRIVEIADDGERQTQQKRLKTELLATLVKSREEVTRAAEDEAEAPAAVARDADGRTKDEAALRDLLMQLPVEHPGL